MKKKTKEKKFEFPTAFTVLFIVLIIALALTYIVPAGSYERLSYVEEDGVFIVEDQFGEQEIMPATQETLDEMNIVMDLEKFEDGSINKPIAIPGTYSSIKQRPQGLLDFIMASVDGVMDTVDIMIFVLILGGIIGIINKTGTFDAAMAALSRKTQGKQFLLIVAIAVITAVGGSTFGLAEETVALYPILLPIFLAAGYDAITGIAAIYLGAAIGAMFSTVNPFSIVIASDASGIIQNMGKGIFAIVQMVIFTFLGFFIPSSSGLATLSMPIMAPLADTVNLSRAVVVTVYNWGHGLVQFITPTGLILATLELVDVTYDKWLKFVLPLMGIIAAFAAIMLVLNTYLA